MRDDISDKLVHLTKGVSGDSSQHKEEALRNLVSILSAKTLNGGTGMIKGSHNCVCFSEAPITKLVHLLGQKDQGKFKYQPYGIMVDKKWLFEKGGRPVIYGPDCDYENLPDDMKYRHVRFWLSDQYNVDHTWEREWRIKTDCLQFTEEDVTVVLPDRTAKEAFEMIFTHYNWHFMVLSDLGVSIEAL